MATVPTTTEDSDAPPTPPDPGATTPATPTATPAAAHTAAGREAPPSRQPPRVPRGPEPLLVSRKEIDVLYDGLDAVRRALEILGVDYIVTGGSLLGAIRQHSILFCDDDIDIAIVDQGTGQTGASSVYETIVVPKLQAALDEVVRNDAYLSQQHGGFVYQVRPWEGGDRVRSRRYGNVFLDLFCLRRYPTEASFRSVVGIKANGSPQPESYVRGILDTIYDCCALDSFQPCHGNTNHHHPPKPYHELFPFWQFSTRKAIELWPKEIYRASAVPSPATQASSPEAPLAPTPLEDELFPLQKNLKLGPLTGVCGPHTPVKLLKRAFGDDCFEVYYRSISHQNSQKQHPKASGSQKPVPKDTKLPPKVAPGGTWEHSPKVPLEEEHYLPIQPVARARRRPTLHCRQSLLAYLEEQTAREARLSLPPPPPRTVYTDGVFDLFHAGHLEAIRQCAALGTRVLVGVTGDADAAGYKRPPIVPESERSAIVRALKGVDGVVCPCPLVVTEEFLERHGIDLVVHGFASEADARKQAPFFEIPAADWLFPGPEHHRSDPSDSSIAGCFSGPCAERENRD